MSLSHSSTLSFLRRLRHDRAAHAPTTQPVRVLSALRFLAFGRSLPRLLFARIPVSLASAHARCRTLVSARSSEPLDRREPCSRIFPPPEGGIPTRASSSTPSIVSTRGAQPRGSSPPRARDRPRTSRWRYVAPACVTASVVVADFSSWTPARSGSGFALRHDMRTGSTVLQRSLPRSPSSVLHPWRGATS